MDDELLPIGRFARLAGLTVGALRHYDEEGVLAPADVDPPPGTAATGATSCRRPARSRRSGTWSSRCPRSGRSWTPTSRRPGRDPPRRARPARGPDRPAPAGAPPPPHALADRRRAAGNPRRPRPPPTSTTRTSRAHPAAAPQPSTRGPPRPRRRAVQPLLGPARARGPHARRGRRADRHRARVRLALAPGRDTRRTRRAATGCARPRLRRARPRRAGPSTTPVACMRVLEARRRGHRGLGPPGRRRGDGPRAAVAGDPAGAAEWKASAAGAALSRTRRPGRAGGRPRHAPRT